MKVVKPSWVQERMATTRMSRLIAPTMVWAPLALAWGRGERMLANEKFVANAKPEVVEAEREKLARYRRELDALSG